MTTWITADWHLGDERMELMNRPFKNGRDMIDCIISNMSCVNDDDYLIINGDVCYKNTPEAITYLDAIKGRKILIRGNHDINLSKKDMNHYFDLVIEEGDGYYFRGNNGEIAYYITHYPTQAKSEYFNLVGHIHSSWKVQLNMLNVGVDCNHFRPYNINKIPFIFNAICNFYDKDVWCAYDPVNEQFKGKRGAQSKYFIGEKNENTN